MGIMVTGRGVGVVDCVNGVFKLSAVLTKANTAPTRIRNNVRNDLVRGVMAVFDLVNILKYIMAGNGSSVCRNGPMK